jgi:hypothetical protein
MDVEGITSNLTNFGKSIDNTNNHSILFNNSKTKNFKGIKKLDLRGIDQHKSDQDTQKNILNIQNKQDNETFPEKQISSDLEKYIEFLSKEDKMCDKLLNFQIPYFFLGINSKQSLNSNGKEVLQNHIKNKEDFILKYEKKFENSINQNNTNINLSSSLGTIPIFNGQKISINSSLYKKNKFLK